MYNTITKLNRGIFLMLAVTMAGCSKSSKQEVQPSNNVAKAKIAIISGDKQSGIFGESLTAALELKITPPPGKKANQYTVVFSMIQGNGVINNNNGYPGLGTPDTSGNVKANWLLGCNNTTQKVKAYLYANVSFNGGVLAPLPGLADDSLIMQASGVEPTGWGKSCGCGIPDSYYSQIVTYDKKTLFLASNGLYTSDDGGINWSKVVATGIPNWSGIKNAQFNSKGWLYVVTENDGVFYSKDLKFWQTINNGILDHRTPTGFLVADDLLMVSFYFDGPYITTDNGGFWQKLLVGGGSQRYYYMKRHPNGNLYLFNDWGNFWMSKDIGKTWQLVPLNYGYFVSQPYGFDIGPDGKLYIGSDDATIAQLSPVTLQGTAKRYYQWNGWSQSVSQIQFYNNDVYFLVTAAPQAGVYSIGNNWGRIEMNFPKTINSYYIKPDGGFLLWSYDGLYYRNK